MRKLIQMEIPFEEFWPDGRKYGIGDIVPFTTTHGKTGMAKIYEFGLTKEGTVYLRGINIKTRKKVWYPVYLSKKLKSSNMKDKDRADLRVILANFVQISARDPHEPDTMLAAVDWIEKWIDEVGDNKVMRATSPFIKPPSQEEINMLNRDHIDKIKKQSNEN